MGMAIKRGIIVFISFLIQIAIYFITYLFLSKYITIITVLYELIGILLALYLIKNSKNYSYTLPWILILLSFPLVGALLYLFFGDNKSKSKLLKNIIKQEEDKRYLIQDSNIREMYA